MSEITDEILTKACEVAFSSQWPFIDVEMMRAALEAVAPMIVAAERDRANAATAQAAHMADTLRRIEKRLEAAGIDVSFGAEIGVRNLVEWYTKLIREIDAVHAAIPPHFLLVPPDGGDVRTSEAVAAMTERLAACACSRPNTNPLPWEGSET